MYCRTQCVTVYCSRVISACEHYHANKDVWRQIAPLGVARMGAACAAYKDWIIVAGGYGITRFSGGLHYGTLNSVEAYNVRTNQ